MQFNFGEMAMSRPLKFRAWDGKEMWTGFEFVPIDIIVPPAWKKTTNKNMIWQQYTGLTDKAGKEIYEGDILGKRPYGYLKSDGTKDGRYRGKEWQCFPIEWGEYDASEAGLVSGYECETDGKYAGWNINFGGYDDELKEFEVIGNIYEHPHLLEDK